MEVPGCVLRSVGSCLWLAGNVGWGEVEDSLRTSCLNHPDTVWLPSDGGGPVSRRLGPLSGRPLALPTLSSAQ